MHHAVEVVPQKAIAIKWPGHRRCHSDEMGASALSRHDAINDSLIARRVKFVQPSA